MPLTAWDVYDQVGWLEFVSSETTVVPSVAKAVPFSPRTIAWSGTRVALLSGRLKLLVPEFET
jgi:hypothetical protein